MCTCNFFQIKLFFREITKGYQISSRQQKFGLPLCVSFLHKHEVKSCLKLFSRISSEMVGSHTIQEVLFELKKLKKKTTHECTQDIFTLSIRNQNCTLKKKSKVLFFSYSKGKYLNFLHISGSQNYQNVEFQHF